MHVQQVHKMQIMSIEVVSGVILVVRRYNGYFLSKNVHKNVKEYHQQQQQRKGMNKGKIN